VTTKRTHQAKRREAQEEMRAEAIAGHILADLELPTSGDPPQFVPDHEFICADCGRREVWTAEKQRRWSKTPGGPNYSRAFGCRERREARRTATRPERTDSEDGNFPSRSGAD
jgi:hypothetical protein